MRSVAAGATAFAIVFAAGFALGTIRVLALAPALGAFRATLVELPFMLAISWFACRFAIVRFAVPRAVAARLAMGATAFVLLIGAELCLGLVAFGRSLAEQGAAWTSPDGAIGLAAQGLFALFPLVAARGAQLR